MIRFISTLSIHGVSRLYKSNILLVKLVWTICILISCSAGFYTVSKSITDYSSYEVITNVKRVTYSKLTFPAITICTKGFYLDLRANITSIRFDDYLPDLTTSSFKDKNIDNKLEYFNISKSFGKCVRFNGFQDMTKNLKVAKRKADYIFGINISLTSDSVMNIHREAEVYILDNYLHGYRNADPLKLSLNNSYVISFTRAETEKKLPDPYSDCSDKEDNTYRQENCMEQCFNEQMAQSYNCSIPSYYTAYKDLVECGGNLVPQVFTEQVVSEYYERHVALIDNNITTFDGYCHQKCESLECESIRFDKQVISSSRNFGFEFYFSDFSTQEITQIPKMTGFTLIGSIGGALGLFIGVRFLSLVEILELIIELLYVLFK